MKDGKGAIHYRYDSNSGKMGVKWVYVGGSRIKLCWSWGNWGVWKILWKGEGEKKHSISSNCSTIHQKPGRCRPGGHVPIFVLSIMQDKALVPKDILGSHWYVKDILASHWYGKDQWSILYRWYFCQNGKPHKNQKSLLQFTFELSDALILANKMNPSSSRGWLPKRKSLEAPATAKKPTQTFSVTDVCFGQVAHWPSPTTNKNQFRLCSMICKCNVPNARSFSVYWLITTVLLISIQNHRQISSCRDFFQAENI